MGTITWKQRAPSTCSTTPPPVRSPVGRRKTERLAVHLCRHRGGVGAVEVAIRDREAEQLGGVEAEDAGALLVGQAAHRALDGRAGVRPGALVVGVVVGPQEVADQPVLT